MDAIRQKIIARCTLAAFAAVCVGWLVRLDYGKKISTNILDLIPPSERSAELGLIRSFAGDVEAKVMLFAVSDPARPQKAPIDAARMLAAELTRSPAFAEAVALGGGTDNEKLGRQIFERRYTLLLPKWLGEEERKFIKTGLPQKELSSWLADRAAADLESFLNRPDALPMQRLILNDPLLLVPSLIERVHLLGAPGTGSDGHALVWARITNSPLSEEGQGPVFAAIETALGRVRSQYPSTETRWSGINRFAAASRARIQSEIKLLNALSILVVLVAGCILVRRTWKMLHLIPVMACSLLGAWTFSTLAFSRLHILVFVIGSLLSGVAVDYGFYIYMQPSLRPGESYADKLGRLLKPLLAGCLTTVIGFSLLLFSDLPFIRQVGFFVAAGLLCALASAILYFAQLENPFLESRTFDRLRASGRGWMRWGPRILAVAAGAIALIGPWSLRWRDDVRELDIPNPVLKANEHELRKLFGETEGRSVFLTYGPTVADAREHLEAFLNYETAAAPRAESVSFGLVFPTASDWKEFPSRLARLNRFADDFKVALERHGFLSSSFTSFFNDWKALRARPPQGRYEALYDDLQRSLTGPLAQLYEAHGPVSWFVTIVDTPESLPPPSALFTVSASQLGTLNTLFTRYRWSALRLSVIGLSLVIASVFAIYPFRRGLRIALIPAGSCFFVFGLFGLFGQTLNLFHLLGAFLGVCLSHNYAIFSSDNAATRSPPPPSIRLSALSAAGSFGVLSLSRIPVVHAMGMTVALIVLTALAAIELEPLVRGPFRPKS